CRSIMSGPKDLVFVFLQGFDPRTDIGCVLLWIVRNPAFGCHEYACEFGTQFLFRIVRVAETIAFGQRLPVQAGWMASPVRQLVKGGAVITGGVLEGIFRR